MKKQIIPGIILILIVQHSFTQIKSTKDTASQTGFWSIGYTGGAAIKLIDNTRETNKSFAGYTTGISLYINIDEKSSIGVEANYGRFANKDIYHFNRLEKDYISYIELTFGPKFQLGKNYYLSVHLGNYFLTYNYEDEYYSPYTYFYSNERSATYPGFGASFEGGKIFKFSKSFDLTVNGKLSLGLPGMEPVIYGMLRAGVIFNNGKTAEKDRKKLPSEKTHSISLSGGITDPSFFNNDNYRITPNIGIEGTLKTSPKIELYGNVTYNKILDEYSYFFNTAYGSITEITTGPRFIIGSQKYAGFVQPGVGLYLYYHRIRSSSSEEEMFYGINASAGFMINVFNDFRVVIKSGAHIIFDEQVRPGGYINTSGGIRYEL